MKNEQSSVLSFLILTFVLSSPFWILGSLFEIQLLPGLPIGALAAFTPAVAAAIILYQDGRLSAVQDLLRRSFDANCIKNRKWYFIFVMFNPSVALLSFYIMRGTGVAVPNPILTITTVPLVAIFFIAALGEEIGWTGYATEPILRQWGILRGGILLGLVWVAFHLIPLTHAGRSFEWIAWWSLGTLSYRMIMVWLYAHAGDSLFAAALFHTMINVSWQLFPVSGSFYNPGIFSLVTIALGVLLVTSWHLLSRVNRNAP